MNEGEDGKIDDPVHEAMDDSALIDSTVRKIFDGIFEEPMRKFNQPLNIIKDNEFGLVWREENERHEKIMTCAQSFIQALTTSFSSVHVEAAKHIEGSTCDAFLIYVRKKLSNSALGQHPFEGSCNEIKDLITRRILKIKEALETKHDEQPENRSDLEIMIKQTDLFDAIHIYHALLCCQIAYDCKDPEQINGTLEKLEKKHLLRELAVSYQNENVPKYVMARCGDVLYVSFKGMQSHNFVRTEISYRGEICKGISEEAKKIPLKYFAREVMQNKRVVFSGHSSGGGIASLVLLFLLEKFKQQPASFLKSHFKCITFGLMPFAGQTFATYVQAIPGAKDCFCHIVEENDIVTKLFGVVNETHMHEQLWSLVDNILEVPLDILSESSVSGNMTTPLKSIIQKGLKISRKISSSVVSPFRYLDIFGMYYILDNSTQGQRAFNSGLRAEEATDALRINECDNLRRMQHQYLINHRMERYAHEVEIALAKELREIEQYGIPCAMEISNDIPEVTEVRFENIGKEVVAKVAGISMWFVYSVSIEDVSGNGKDLQVDVMKSNEFEVQAKMRETNLSHKDHVWVRVKTHFGNSKYLKGKSVPAKTTTYKVSRRQQQLAKHSPSEVIELAYLSALLERHQEASYSKRFNAIKTFFKDAVSVVPLESLFFAMTQGTPEVMLQCCEIFTTQDAIPTTIQPSTFLISKMKQAVTRIRCHQSRMKVRDSSETLGLCWNDVNQVLDDTVYRIVRFLEKHKKNGKKHYSDSVCSTNLEVIYPSTDVQNTGEHKFKRCKAPMSLLTEGRKEIKEINDKIIAEHSESSAKTVISQTNTLMLTTLNGFRKEFRTCSILLGAFMESQVKIPLKKDGGDTHVDKIAKQAGSFGLSVWGLLILPFQYVNKMIGNLSEDFDQLLIDFSRQLYNFPNAMFPPLEREFPDYDEKLEFLLGSMKQSWTCNQEYVSYSLERQLEEQCRNRKILHDTPIDEILNQWSANFENETLTLVAYEYRRLVARWIKWSLMINNLRDSLASQIAVGVIGLVNSGKSKFVRSMFGKETITGTTHHERTTVPLIYNLNPDVKGMDVIDFPGVDDSDRSIPKLAELLLSLTRIVIFVVDYRRAHTESTKQWLDILAKENVPVLVCLTFADKLYADLMGKKDGRDAEKLKSGVEDQFKTIKKQIGQPENGCRRDFKLTVFAFDNDSKLDCEEGKEKLRNAGLSDELDVGRWIAAKLQDFEQNDVSQNIITFIEEKQTSTLNSNRRTPTPGGVVKEQSSDASKNDELSGINKKETSDHHRPSPSKGNN